MGIKVTGEEDLVLTGESVWITVDNLSVQVRKTDEGVVTSIFVLDHEDDGELASTYAFFNEASEHNKLPCMRVMEDNQWVCENAHTGCMFNDGHNFCTAVGESACPLEEI